MMETVGATATLKRKASLSPAPEDVTSKRLKEDDVTEGNSKSDTKSPNDGGVDQNFEAPANSNVDAKSPEQVRPPSGSTAPEPERNAGPVAARKSIALDEKKRAKRLFGGILGTLSKSQSSAQQKKRLEVDKRQQEKVQKERAESDKIRAEKLAKRKAARAKEQEKLEEDMMDARHSRMLAMAHSLKTRSDPRLYYQPYKLTDEQEDIIDDQISDARDTIDRELEEFRRKKGISDDNHSHDRKESAPDSSGDRSSPSPKATVGEHKNSLQDTNHEPAPVIPSSYPLKYKDPDDNNEEMVQDKEDTVIY